MSSVLLRRLSAVLAAVALAGTLVLLTGGAAQAAGSGDLMPTNVTCATNTACRVTVEWRTSTYGPAGGMDVPLRRRTLFSVFAQQGEQILTGSSSVGDRGGDVVIWNPDVIQDTEAAVLPVVVPGTNGFRCSVQRAASPNPSLGVIGTRAQELAGARSVDGTANPGGYQPCVYTAPVTGIYRVAFYGSAGGSSDNQVKIDRDISAFTFGAPDPATAVIGWDVTVRAAGSSNAIDLPGRLFTYQLAGFSGLNGRAVDIALTMTTPQGFRYLVDTNGFDPSGFLLYANGTGFLDPDGSPLHHDVVAATTATNTDAEKMPALAGGTHLGRPEFPLSLEPLADETLAALAIPRTPVAPTLDGLTFTGHSVANESYEGQGGTFTFTAGTAGPYELVVSRDGVDFDPARPGNRVLRGTAAAGPNTVAWDGTDNTGAAFPAGAAYAVRAFQRTGEYHVLMLDVESSLRGGPSLVLTNPPGGTCPFTGAVSTGINCSRAFYDDRGYVTSTGVRVGTAEGLLAVPAVGTAPGVLASNTGDGFDSLGTQRAFGTTSSSTAGSFGDTKGLDTWTYLRSPVRTTTVNVVAEPDVPEDVVDPPATPAPTTAPPVAGDDAVETLAGQTLALPGSALLGNDTGSGLRVTGWSTPAHGTTRVDADGALTYEPHAGTSGTDTFTYTVTDDADRSATATVTVTVRPDARDDSAVTSVDTPVTVPAARGLLANDAGTDLTVTADDAAHGTLAVDPDGGFTYTPDPGFVGGEDIGYEVTDGSGLTGTARLLLTVVGGGVVDGARDDQVTGVPGEPVTVHVLANDVPRAGRDWDPASLGLVGPGSATPVRELTVPAVGTWRVTSVNRVSFTPVDDSAGTASAGYLVLDSTGATATAVVSVTYPVPLPVEEPTTPPVDEDPTPPPVDEDPTPPVLVDPTPPVANQPTPPVAEDLVSIEPPAEVLPVQEPVRPVAGPATDGALAVAPALPVPATAAAAVLPVEEPVFPLAPAYPTVPVLPEPAAPVAPAPARATPRATSAAPGEPPTTSAQGDGGPYTPTAASVAVGVLSVGTAAGLAVLGATWLRRRRQF